MNIRKNMEAIFLAASITAVFAAYATAEVPAVRSVKTVPVYAVEAPVADSNVQVVQVKAKRLTAAEKAALK